VSDITIQIITVKVAREQLVFIFLLILNSENCNHVILNQQSNEFLLSFCLPELDGMKIILILLKY